MEDSIKKIKMNYLFLGQIIHTKSINEIEIFTNGYIVVENGKVSKIFLAKHNPKISSQHRSQKSVTNQLTKMTKPI